MKINIDNNVFNKTIRENKLEVANWLLENNCPIDSSVYLQNLDTIVLSWLKEKNLPFDRNCLKDVILKTSEITILNWFIDNGAIISYESISSCIIKNDINTMDLLKNMGVKLSRENYIKAVKEENIPVLDWLKENNCPYSSLVEETALKYQKQNSLNWLVQNNFL